MGRCPHCGEAVSEEPSDEDGARCPHCAVILPGETETGGVSRRGLLTWGGGSALATFAGVGAGWFAFIHEPTGPEEDVVREYVEALDRSHFYTAHNLFHEDAPGEAWRPHELPGMDRVDLTVSSRSSTASMTRRSTASRNSRSFTSTSASTMGSEATCWNSRSSSL